MKNIIILLTFFCFTNIFSQKKKSYFGEIIYEQTINFGVEFSEEYQMVFTENWSFNQEINIKKKEAYKTAISNNGGVSTAFISARKNATAKYFFNSDDNLFFKDNFENTIFVVAEEKKFPKWELLNETKKIGEFECMKATVTFRGRTYFAWYALDIPLPCGPWKARGLPGIILEFYEKNYVFKIITKKISITNQTTNNIFLPTKEIEKAISLKDYFLEKEKIKDYYFQKLSSQQAKGSKPLKRDKNCEDCNNTILEIFENK
jgi:GLPGLI family protein